MREPETPAHGGVWRDSRVAAKYLEGVRGAIPLAAEQLDVLRRLLAALERPVERFLDLGCGDGVLADAVLGLFPDAQGTLLDFSPAMLEAARKRFANRGATLAFVETSYGGPEWVAALGGQRFDAVVSGYSIHHQPDERKHAIYREIFGLLEPGGLLVNIEHVSSPSGWVERIFDERFIDSLLAHHRAQGGTKSRGELASEYYYREDKQANILAPVEAQCEWLRETGFIDAGCYLKVFELAVFGGRRP